MFASIPAGPSSCRGPGHEPGNPFYLLDDQKRSLPRQTVSVWLPFLYPPATARRRLASAGALRLKGARVVSNFAVAPGADEGCSADGAGRVIAAGTVTPDGGDDPVRPALSATNGRALLDSRVFRPGSLPIDCGGHQPLTLAGFYGGPPHHCPSQIDMCKGEGHGIDGVGIGLPPAAAGGVRVATLASDMPAAGDGRREGQVLRVDGLDLTSKGPGLDTAMALVRGQRTPSVPLRFTVAGGSGPAVDVERSQIDVTS